VSVLERIVEQTRDEVRRRSREVPLADLQAQLQARDERPFQEALIRPGVSIIAEHKRRSPSAGDIRPGSTVAEIVEAYERGGAAALSILTEGPNFGGSLEDLREARAASNLPILRKDFIVDPYQVYETAAWGADALLLIVAALEPKAIADLYALARELDLDVLVEVHDESDLNCALEMIDADVIGINNRNLADFSVDVQRTYDLLADVPAGKTVVSESGFHAREQLDELERVGIDACLVGESLMRSPHPETALRILTGEPPSDATTEFPAL
jgi:indole-3-glycerol phosphate synthase